MTLCNMAIEAGATCGICYPDMVTVDYPLALHSRRSSRPDEAVGAGAEYAKCRPDADADYAGDIRRLRRFARSNRSRRSATSPIRSAPCARLEGTPVNQVYIGSCTNGRLEDLRIAAGILKGHTHQPETPRHRLAGDAEDLPRRARRRTDRRSSWMPGFCVTNPTCGACLGMSNGVLASGESCASTTNRNFNGRMGKGGMVHLMSPATAAATAARRSDHQLAPLREIREGDCAK